MNYLKYFVLLALLLAGHFFLAEWGLFILCILIGIASGVSEHWLRTRFLWVLIPLAELTAGLLFWIFFWNKASLSALSANIHLSGALLAGMVIGINLLTVSCVTASALYLTRVALSRRLIRRSEKIIA